MEMMTEQVHRYRNRLRDDPAWRRTNRDAVMRVIIYDLRRLADDLELLDDGAQLPEHLAAVVQIVRETVSATPPIEMPVIVSAVGVAFHVTPQQMVGIMRTQHIAMARQVAMYLVRELTAYSFPRIAEYFGRDHSTVIHAHALVARRVANEPQFASLMARLKLTLAEQTADGITAQSSIESNAALQVSA